jgi:hypothetical protein
MNMKLTKNMKSILAGLAILAFMIVVVGFVKSKSGHREGLANPAHTEFVSKGISNDVQSAHDALHLVKYQKEYKEILDDMAKWCDLLILKTVVTNKISMDEDINTKNTEVITALNQWAQFRDNLQSVSNNVLSNLPSAPSQ